MVVRGAFWRGLWKGERGRGDGRLCKGLRGGGLSIYSGRCGWEGAGKALGEDVVVVVVRGAFVKWRKPRGQIVGIGD